MQALSPGQDAWERPLNSEQKMKGSVNFARLVSVKTGLEQEPSKFYQIFQIQQRRIGMSQSPSKKKCEIKIEAENYLRHLNRLQRLRDGTSPDQCQRAREQKKLSESIRTLRKIHAYNRKFRQKQMKQVEYETKVKNYDRVRSVVKGEFCRPLLPIAPKHKVTLKPILDQNQKILERIIKVKSQFDFQKKKNPHDGIKAYPQSKSIDFLTLFKTSRMNEPKPQQFALKLGKFRKYQTLRLHISSYQFSKIFKDDHSQYLLEVQSKGMKDRSELFIPTDFSDFNISLKIPSKLKDEDEIHISAVKVLDFKELFKGSFSFNKKQAMDLTEESSERQIQKQVYSLKGKSEGALVITFSSIGEKERKASPRQLRLLRA